MVTETVTIVYICMISLTFSVFTGELVSYSLGSDLKSFDLQSRFRNTLVIF